MFIPSIIIKNKAIPLSLIAYHLGRIDIAIKNECFQGDARKLSIRESIEKYQSMATNFNPNWIQGSSIEIVFKDQDKEIQRKFENWESIDLQWVEGLEKKFCGLLFVPINIGEFKQSIEERYRETQKTLMATDSLGMKLKILLSHLSPIVVVYESFWALDNIEFFFERFLKKINGDLYLSNVFEINE